jgi:methylmalonyl-CoA carboxyltransferase large subunit
MATRKPTAVRKTPTPRAPDLAQVLRELQAQLASLTERLERLEARASATGAPAPASARAPEPPPAPAQEISAPGLSEEEVLAVSAALAAYLGVRARIRQIRLLSSSAWAQQGRVSIQASHRLHS